MANGKIVALPEYQCVANGKIVALPGAVARPHPTGLSSLLEKPEI